MINREADRFLSCKHTEPYAQNKLNPPSVREVMIVKNHSVAIHRTGYVATWINVFARNFLQGRGESAHTGLTLQVGAMSLRSMGMLTLNPPDPLDEYGSEY